MGSRFSAYLIALPALIRMVRPFLHELTKIVPLSGRVVVFGLSLLVTLSCGGRSEKAAFNPVASGGGSAGEAPGSSSAAGASGASESPMPRLPTCTSKGVVTIKDPLVREAVRIAARVEEGAAIGLDQ